MPGPNLEPIEANLSTNSVDNDNVIYKATSKDFQTYEMEISKDKYNLRITTRRSNCHLLNLHGVV